MKIVSISTLFVASLAMAEPPANAPGAEGGKGRGPGPCSAIEKACEAAGFVKGGYKEKKGLLVDCMKPLVEGKSVEGVSVSAGDVEQCKKKHQEMREKKEMRGMHGMKEMKGQAPAPGATPAK